MNFSEYNKKKIKFDLLVFACLSIHWSLMENNCFAEFWCNLIDLLWSITAWYLYVFLRSIMNIACWHFYTMFDEPHSRVVCRVMYSWILVSIHKKRMLSRSWLNMIFPLPNCVYSCTFFHKELKLWALIHDDNKYEWPQFCRYIHSIHTFKSLYLYNHTVIE